MGLFRRVARARLASLVIRRLRRAGFADARYHSATFSVSFTLAGDDVPSVLQLDALFAQRPRGRRRRVDRFIAGFLRDPGLPVDWHAARPLLRPVLRGVTTPADVTAPLSRPALPFLAEFVVVDHPETMTYVSVDNGWGVDAEEVFAAARANLTGATLLGEATEPVVVQFVDDGDAYWASHLLLDGWLAGLAGQVGGVPVAFAPDRGTLLVTADHSDHLPVLFAQAEAVYLASPRAITPMAYVSDADGRTVPYEATPGSPYELCVRRAQALLAAREYARQAEQLPLAAELLIAENGRTRALWPQDGPALLPVADEVQIGETIRPWCEVVPLLTEQTLTPPRWRGESWPKAGSSGG
ncbi:hypothetical protein DMB66_42740 [Actinoplanes sp. ATCC 53533]|uniref:hypothetical protein n=1 Tax=Actinoplanes sp. ATCC 53533 TaxID=1288362 RepID=UPI000F790D08|nr:hypothetical protein [Actinoplanes sp. ATCC 53533]RSM51097.1 hypothetical protein DMB66_42740 [Actinoplanes sp. ATCC 53533]